MENEKIHAGDRVYWSDPDDGICSGDYTVISLDASILFLKNDLGSEVEAFVTECKKL